MSDDTKQLPPVRFAVAMPDPMSSPPTEDEVRTLQERIREIFERDIVPATRESFRAAIRR